MLLWNRSSSDDVNGDNPVHHTARSGRELDGMDHFRSDKESVERASYMLRRFLSGVGGVAHLSELETSRRIFQESYNP